MYHWKNTWSFKLVISSRRTNAATCKLCPLLAHVSELLVGVDFPPLLLILSYNNYVDSSPYHTNTNDDVQIDCWPTKPQCLRHPNFVHSEQMLLNLFFRLLYYFHHTTMVSLQHTSTWLMLYWLSPDSLNCNVEDTYKQNNLANQSQNKTLFQLELDLLTIK